MATEAEETRDERQAGKLPPIDVASADLYAAAEHFRATPDSSGYALSSLMGALGRWTAEYRDKHPGLGRAVDVSEEIPFR